MREIISKKISLKNGETIHYRETKTGEEVLLLIHGNMNSSLNWDLLMENLSQQYKIYAIDLRGFGESTYHNSIESLKDFSEDIKLFADELELGKFVLSGWSLGGAIAMRFTLDYPNHVKKLILLESSSVKGFPVHKRSLFGKLKKEYITKRDEMKKMIKMIEKSKVKNKRWFLKMLLNKSLYSTNQPDTERYELYLDEMIKQRNLLDVNMALTNFNISSTHNGVVDGTDEAKNISVPTLVIQGDQDTVVTINMAKETKNEIGDNAKLVKLKDCGHSPLLDDLDSLTEIYESFISE